MVTLIHPVPMSTPLFLDFNCPVSALVCILGTKLIFASSTLLSILRTAKFEEELVCMNGKGWSWDA